jgi:hypothetical protein
MSLLSEAGKKAYSAPELHKLTRDQATLILIGHASCGHRGAIELLTVVYPLRNLEESRNAREAFQPGDFADPVSETSSLAHRIFTAFGSAREDFWRFVRG